MVNNTKQEFDIYEWSTIIFKPTFWWRVKALFKCPEIIFCWGQDRWTTRGLKCSEYISVCGVPKDIEKDIKSKWMIKQ